jgi:hypothetical protein
MLLYREGPIDNLRPADGDKYQSFYRLSIIKPIFEIFDFGRKLWEQSPSPTVGAQCSAVRATDLA